MNKYPKKIDCLLKEGKRCQEKIGIVGPTGPTGPQGPATITVGNVVTGLPGSDAAVTNTGTQENVILTFTIPQGPTGPVGAQGAQGLRGPQGMQGEQGTIGPQGIQGPTGPVGPAAEAVFGRKYNNQANAINLQPNVAQTISLGTTGPLSNVTGDTQDILTTTTDGNYEIEYFFSAQAGTAAEVTVEVIQGSTPIDSSTITKNLLANTQTDFVGSTINAIDANTNISLNVKSTQTVTITPASGTNAYLNIMKI